MEEATIDNHHSCDACERNIDEMRFVCLCCRSLQLCEECYKVQDSDLQQLETDTFSSIRREHKQGHIFARVFDYQSLHLK